MSGDGRSLLPHRSRSIRSELNRNAMSIAIEQRAGASTWQWPWSRMPRRRRRAACRLWLGWSESARRPGPPARRVSHAFAAILAMSTFAFSAAAQEAGGDRGHETRGNGHDRPQVWFAPNDDLGRGPNRDRYLNHDFPHLFDPNPAWDAKIDVFKISPMMGSAVGPADELGRINAFLKDHRIALSVDTGGVTMDNPGPTPGECGYGVEGMARPGRNAVSFKRLKSLGIEVAYVTLDEPLTYGHYYNRKNACGYSIEDVARRTANEIAQIRQVYPNVPVVDVEAPQMTTTAQWNADFPKWLKAYRDASGSPFDAVVYDMVMSQPWQAIATPGI